MSAGSKPTGKVHLRSLALLERERISTTGLYSKSWDDLPIVPDIVITVCGNADKETCPVYLGSALRTHWGVDDPAIVTGTEEEMNAAFEKAYRTLRTRIEYFFDSRLGELIKNKSPSVQQKLDSIGTSITG